MGQLLELQGLFQRLPGDVAQHHPVGCRMWLHAGASLAMLEKRAWLGDHSGTEITHWHEPAFLSFSFFLSLSCVSLDSRFG